MINLKNKHSKMIGIAAIAATNLFIFQNCSAPVNFGTTLSSVSDKNVALTTGDTSGGVSGGGSSTPATPVDPADPIGSLPICSGVSCSLSPLTNKPAVSTILMALGDEVNSQLVVNKASAQFIAESVVRYTSPVANPKILLVHDHNSNSESPEDFAYTANVLLARYNVVEINEPEAGMSSADFAGYDIIWFNNPGYPMGSKMTRDALLAFKGGVVLEGDDLSQGEGFSLQDLTGLKYIDNGTSFSCGGSIYGSDNNSGHQFIVSLDPNQLSGADSSALQFKYGNDLDNTAPARSDLQILASAKGDVASCTQTRPAIVRYQK